MDKKKRINSLFIYGIFPSSAKSTGWRLQHWELTLLLLLCSFWKWKWEVICLLVRVHWSLSSLQKWTVDVCRYACRSLRLSSRVCACAFFMLIIINLSAVDICTRRKVFPFFSHTPKQKPVVIRFFFSRIFLRTPLTTTTQWTGAKFVCCVVFIKFFVGFCWCFFFSSILVSGMFASHFALFQSLVFSWNEFSFVWLFFL